jgi:hypothetical protein
LNTQKQPSAPKEAPAYLEKNRKNKAAKSPKKEKNKKLTRNDYRYE